MNGEGISFGQTDAQSQPQNRACYVGKTLKKCNNKGGTSDVYVIDVESDECGDVIIIDVPESLPKRLQGLSSRNSRKGNKYSLGTIICIDLDDAGDKNNEHNNLDEVQFVQENGTPVKLSKCMRTYSGKASTSIHYDLNAYSASASSDDDDGPEYEFEGSYGKLKEQWEKAFIKRQNDAFSAYDLVGTSRSFTNTCQHTEIGNNDVSHQDSEIGKKTEVNGSLERQNDVCNSQSGLVDTAVDFGFFGCEMHKETDEYKRALEVELESRQREFQIQVEEEQTLRQLQKRKEAERMRLLDMERRQKQRVEDVRETQKKDEENLNKKEQLRAEVRKDLKKLETTCHDMKSILHGLGIKCDGGENAARVAFKRALLCFHPDRASQSDMQQQVEAEEKFKLINRMKEKFWFTS